MLFGHGEKIRIFKKLADEGKLGHAYLFFGDAQIGKSYFGKLLAAYLETGIFDLPESPLIDSAVFSPDEKGTLGIGRVREIRNFLWQTPLRSSRRVVLIEDAEALTAEAQGALLKIVEEPPVHGLILFTAHDPQVLLPPLLSRLSKVHFARLAKLELERTLIENFKVAPAKAKAVAADSFGRIGRAIGSLEKKKMKKETRLEDELEEKIVSLRKSDLVKNSKKLSWLLDREALARRFNLNQNLQRKATEHELYNE
jgi:DNA polymerase-3 subunit delta'